MFGFPTTAARRRTATGVIALALGGAALVPAVASAGGSGHPPSKERITGGGSVFVAGYRVTHGFELRCDDSDRRQNLEINWDSPTGQHRFHLTDLAGAVCFDEGGAPAAPPVAMDNRYDGRGSGLLDGVPGATAVWSFTDHGEPGTSDTAAYVIQDASGATVLTVPRTALTFGNHQFHRDTGGGPSAASVKHSRKHARVRRASRR